MRKKLPSGSIKRRILTISIPTLIASFSLALLITYIFSQTIMTNYLYAFLRSAQQEMIKSVELVMSDVNLRCVDLMSTPEVYVVAGDASRSHVDKNRRISQILNDAVLGSQSVGDLALVTGRGEVFRMASDSGLSLPARSFFEKIDGSSATAVCGGIVHDANNRPYILLGRKFSNFNTGQNLGYLVVYLKAEELQAVYEPGLNQWGVSCMVSDDYTVMLHHDPAYVGSVIFDRALLRMDREYACYEQPYCGETTIFSVTRLEGTLRTLGLDWQLVSIIPKSKVSAILSKINQYLVWMECLLAIITFAASLLVTSSLTRPLNRLRRSMSHFHGRVRGQLLMRSGASSDEIWELENEYNAMLQRIEDLIQKNNEEKEKQRALELNALQAQINPHFLYNTLDTIAWLAKLQYEHVDKLVLALAKFYRISLHRGDKYITVREELELVKSFLTIEEQRFPDKFTIEYNVDEAVMTQMILKLTLQPVVENAIKHGIRSKPGKGHIVINGFLERDHLILEVIDDGVGFDVNDASVWQKSQGQSGGYGLRNVEQRIKIEYGEQCGIQIYSEVGKGTRVILLLRAC